jgi:hypothetical protein
VIPASPAVSRSFSLHYFWSYGLRNSGRDRMALRGLARKQNSPDDDAAHKVRDEGQASETGGAGLAPQSCLSRRARFIRWHSIHYCQFEFGGMCLKTSERGKPNYSATTRADGGKSHRGGPSREGNRAPIAWFVAVCSAQPCTI